MMFNNEKMLEIGIKYIHACSSRAEIQILENRFFKDKLKEVID